MKLYVDSKNRIKAINSTNRTDLKEVNVDETSEMFPFTGWSETLLCCYKIGYHYPQIGTKEEEVINEETGEPEIINVAVYDEYAVITMFTPYVPTHMISAIQNLDGNFSQHCEDNLVLESELLGAQLALTDVYESNITIDEHLTATQQELLGAQIALTEQYEVNIALEEKLTATQNELLGAQVALTEQYEANLVIENELLGAQVALTEQYETNIALEERIAKLEELVKALTE